jgi:hypothetical protein
MMPGNPLRIPFRLRDKARDVLVRGVVMLQNVEGGRVAIWESNIENHPLPQWAAHLKITWFTDEDDRKVMSEVPQEWRGVINVLRAVFKEARKQLKMTGWVASYSLPLAVSLPPPPALGWWLIPSFSAEHASIRNTYHGYLKQTQRITGPTVILHRDDQAKNISLVRVEHGHPLAVIFQRKGAPFSVPLRENRQQECIIHGSPEEGFLTWLQTEYSQPAAVTLVAA